MSPDGPGFFGEGRASATDDDGSGAVPVAPR